MKDIDKLHNDVQPPNEEDDYSRGVEEGLERLRSGDPEAMAEARRLGIIDYMIGEALGESSED
jgi:hypothetical protein